MPIDFARELNESQYQAVMHDGGPMLIIAGAGSGKTRTIVYRLARLVGQGVDPASILLLTFTRKAAQEMLDRASLLLGRGLSGVAGGTFHSFAYATLKRYAEQAGLRRDFTVMDRGDALEVVTQAKDSLAAGKGDRSFPKRDTMLELISKARNKETSLETLLMADAVHLTPHLEALEAMKQEYARLKNAHSLLDYDDLLFRLEQLLREDKDVCATLAGRFGQIMVDEYQDTNPVQARLVKYLGGQGGVMAVGDDAQSIYGFRGASVENILRFPQEFEGAEIVRLEQNYRSTQPILDLSNAVLENMRRKFEKHLFTERADGRTPRLIHTLSDASQAQVALALIREAALTRPLSDIAVLFRAGYQSYALEVACAKQGIAYRKYGGIRFAEAAHIKDVLAYLRLVANGSDLPSWQRVLTLIPKVGPKTAQKFVAALLSGDEKGQASAKKRFDELPKLLDLLNSLRARHQAGQLTPAQALDMVLSWYAPVLIRQYPDDHPRRQQGLEQLTRIAAGYTALEPFLADICLESPFEDEARHGAPSDDDCLTLSTIHSAKGLEWGVVLILDLVEDRFPSRRALSSPEDLEEERRLMYVACTRARDELCLLAPESVFLRGRDRAEAVRESPLVAELPTDAFEDWRETFGGQLSRSMRGATYTAPKPSPMPSASPSSPSSPRTDPAKLGFCTHKIFGRGKIIGHTPPDKYRVNFPGFGVKVILENFLVMEE